MLRNKSQLRFFCSVGHNDNGKYIIYKTYFGAKSAYS